MAEGYAPGLREERHPKDRRGVRRGQPRSGEAARRNHALEGGREQGRPGLRAVAQVGPDGAHPAGRRRARRAAEPGADGD